AAEGLRVLERKLDALAEVPLHVLQPADVGPADVRDLDLDLAQGARLDALEGVLEVGGGDHEAVEDLLRDLRLVEVDFGEQPAECADGGLAGERAEVGADEAVARARHGVEVHVLGQRHAARVDAQDLAAARRVRHADDDLAVEAARPAERFVEGLTPTFWRASRPSIGVSSWATTRRSTSPVSPRLGAMESISSMKMMLGAFCWASSNTPRRRSSLSP